MTWFCLESGGVLGAPCKDTAANYYYIAVPIMTFLLHCIISLETDRLNEIRFGPCRSFCTLWLLTDSLQASILRFFTTKQKFSSTLSSFKMDIVAFNLGWLLRSHQWESFFRVLLSKESAGKLTVGQQGDIQ